MNKGFTLIELVIVVAILGIIAAIGIPQYIGYTDASRVKTVQSNLRSIYLQQQDYYQRKNAYYATGTCTSVTDWDEADINTNLFNGSQIIVNDGYFGYCINQGTVDDFTAKAIEKGGQNRTFTIDKLNQTNF